jgi:hypothetical protein
VHRVRGDEVEVVDDLQVREGVEAEEGFAGVNVSTRRMTAETLSQPSS